MTRRKEKAMEAFSAYARRAFGGVVRNVRLDHVDAAGYWFTFELANDARRQTYCIRHGDID